MSKTGLGWLVTTLALTALASPLTAMLPATEDDAVAEADALPLELRDSAFDRYIQWRDVGRAYAAFDSTRLADLALQLREGERVLKRGHRTVSAKTLFSDAVEMAQRKHDVKALARFEEAARVCGWQDLQARAASARHSGILVGVRSLDPPSGGVSAQTAALIQSLKTRIDAASLLGDREELEECEHRIGVSDKLPEAVREKLLTAVTAALKTVNRPSNESSRVLRRLAAVSRDLSKDDFTVGRTSWLHSQGYFRETDKMVWMERHQNTNSKLHETARTRQYVELFDSTRKLTIRLENMKSVSRQGDEKVWHPLYTGHWEDPALVPLNAMKLPDIHGLVEKTSGRSFPHLGKRFEVLGAATPRYNCIAWSHGITDRWVWPGDRISDFDKLNAQHGYRRIDEKDFARHVKTDKIVLYAKRNQGKVQATHQARQLADGSWSSKLGALPLIRHLKPEDIDGETYGLPEAVYIRHHQE